MNPAIIPRLITALSACFLAGCITPCATSGGVPADFALSIVVRSDFQSTGVRDPSAVYHLEPDRSLRIAYGPGAGADLFPPMHSRLSPDQVSALYAYIESRKLLVEPTSPRAEARLHIDNPVPPSASALPVLYDVRITHCSKSHHYYTTPDESPPTRALLALLVQMAGGLAGP